MDNFLIDALKQKKLEEQSREQAEKQMTADQFKAISDSVSQATDVLIRFFQAHKPEISNMPQFPSAVATPDVDKVVKQLQKLEKSLKPVVNDNSDVIKSLKDVATEIQKLPEKLTHQDTVEVSNLQELRSTMENGFKDLREALKVLDVKPKITVPKAQVNVEKTDVSSVVKELKKVAKEVREKPITPVSVTPTDPLIRFTPVNMDDSTTVQYYSYIATSGEYYIRKVDKSGAYTTIRFYWGNGGATNHNTDWTGRAALTYTMWSE